MLRRQTQILGQAREASREHWWPAEAAVQVATQMEEDQEVGASLVLAVLPGTADVL